MMAAVFSMQGAGQLAAAIVALITTVGYQKSFLNTTSSWSSCHEVCQLAGDKSWRIVIGFGALPACFALYYRITIPETPRYTFDIAHDIEKAQADITAYMNNRAEGEVDPITQQKTKQRLGVHLTAPRASWRDVFSYFGQWQNFKIIFGTTSSWFFLDLAFYGLGLNNSIVLNAIGYSAGNTIYHSLLHTAIGNLILVCAGSLPGYWLCVGTVDTIGRKPLQILGFLFLTIVFTIIGSCYNDLSEGALLGLYVLAQVFFNWGPNSTTFLIPGECFPTRYRSTGHGVSAAAGKIGAIVAQVIAQPLLTKGAPHPCIGTQCSPWLPHLMQIFALFMLCGTLVSFLVPETKGRTLEELAGEGSTALDSRNGSVVLATGYAGWFMRHNPFSGGKPAGFRYRSPNLGPKSPGIRGKRERLGIMTSPELLDKSRKGKKDRGEKGEKHHVRGPSEESGSQGYSVSVSSHGRRADENDDLYLSGAVQGTLPGWGAGWAVQKNSDRRPPRPVENIMLHDVGSLLK
jgi:PHS family inorganic phosphate transporter-like MFS transporter